MDPSFVLVFQTLEPEKARGMTQLAQGLGFDLPYAFAGHTQLLAHFLKRVLRTIFQPEARLDDLLLITTSVRLRHLLSPDCSQWFHCER